MCATVDTQVSIVSCCLKMGVKKKRSQGLGRKLLGLTMQIERPVKVAHHSSVSYF